MATMEEPEARGLAKVRALASKTLGLMESRNQLHNQGPNSKDDAGYTVRVS
jgi:hypothetical protein